MITPVTPLLRSVKLSHNAPKMITNVLHAKVLMRYYGGVSKLRVGQTHKWILIEEEICPQVNKFTKVKACTSHLDDANTSIGPAGPSESSGSY